MAPNTTLQTVISMPDEVVNLDPHAFDNFVEQKGILLKHFKSMPCPSTISDTGVQTHVGCFCGGSGWLYKEAGVFKGVLVNAPKSIYFREIGAIDSATAYLVVPRYYVESNSRIYFANYDRLDFCCSNITEILVPYWEKINISQKGIDRLNFKAYQIEWLIDNQGKEYLENVDFDIVNGWIKWRGQNRPPFDQSNELGYAYTVRYNYVPSYYINRVLHELRLSAHVNNETNEVEQVRFPMFLELIRELIFINQQNHNDPTYSSSRQGYLPNQGANLRTTP